MDIYLIRHTKTLAQTGLCYGQTDLDVDDIFFEQAAIIKEKLPKFNDEIVIFSSPLQRCQKLAAMFSAHFLIDEKLQELHFGDWENQLFDELPREEIEQWTANFVEIAPPNGECFLDLMQRVDAFWQQLILQKANTVFIFTHAGTIRALLALILKLPPKNTFQFSVDCGSVHKLRYLDGYTYISYLNK